MDQVINNINALNCGVYCELEKSKKNNITIIRSNLNNENDVNTFLHLLHQQTSIQWIIQGQLTNPQKYVHT